ncbi:cell adhesion molecule 3 isoform X1 [Corythoichthys intestinalis]|uniref:cell adhesion molecule 3 isoform X1 n=1 Tax=Corythoichthys intestinalis TaxID=161448 RepID=UPI0025A63E48|nr:cell adhesion molecule 3 isoform X1 [Corythoichthys intestinalis]
MALPLAPLWIVSVMTLLSTVSSNVIFDDDPLQPVTSDETVSVGGAVTLTCHVAESDNSSLQWSNTAQQTLYFGEKRALRDNRIQLHRSTPTELSIIISEVQLSDEGEYTCSIFTMPVRTARATVTVLGVPGKPHISGLENPVQEGGAVTLTCTSTGSKPPARLRWFRGDLELEAGRPDVVESVPDEPTYNVSSELTLEVSRADDNEVVTCAVDHPSLTPGDKRSEQALHVLYSPNVEILPESDLPREGEKFHLECLGNSNPEPSYSWKKKDGELPPLAKDEGTFLRFEVLNKSDNGVYLCFADNGIGSSVGEYTLLVQDPSDPTDSTSSFPTSTPSFSTHASDPTSPTTELSSAFPTTELSSAWSETATTTISATSTVLSNDLFPGLTFNPDSSATPPPSSATPSVSDGLNGHDTPTDAEENIADPTAMSTSSGVDHAVIGGVVAVIVFILLCLLIVFGRYLIRHKGTYLTHEAKGSDDAPDADTAIINAEGGNSGAEDKKEYFI